jgi:hypothetical protein
MQWQILSVALLALSGSVYANMPAASGIRFPCGNPGSPDARVLVRELTSKPAKRGFVRIATIPVSSVTGMNIHFFRAKTSVFGEVLARIEGLTKCTEIEVSQIAFYFQDDLKPRFTAESAVIFRSHWAFKGVSIQLDGMIRQFSNCEIHPAREGAEVAPQNHPALSLLELMKAAPVGESPQ